MFHKQVNNVKDQLISFGITKATMSKFYKDCMGRCGSVLPASFSGVKKLWDCELTTALLPREHGIRDKPEKSPESCYPLKCQC